MRVRTVLALALSSAAVLTTGVAADPAASAASGCAWRSVEVPPNPDQYTKLDNGGLDAVSRDDVWFANSVGENLTPGISAITRWDGKRIRAAKQIRQNPVVSMTVADGSFDSADSGWVVGLEDVVGIGPGALAFATRWYGGRWTRTPLAPTRDPAAASPRIRAVESVSPSDAWAVGDGTDRTGGSVIQRWDGVSWHDVDHPAARVDSAFLDVAVRGTDGWAVGARSLGTETAEPLVEHWDGKSWQAVELPSLPEGSAPAQLGSVSVSGPDDVWVSGFQGGTEYSGRAVPLLGHWDGSTWRWVPDLPDLGKGVLTGVYAAAPNAVWVTLEHVNGDPGELLHWDGASWTSTTFPGQTQYGLHYYTHSVDGTGPDDVWAAASSTETPGSTRAAVRQMVAHYSCAKR